MAFSLFRFARFLRSIFVPTASIIAFSCLLTFIFVLYQPTPGPGSLQKLGWQSWDTVNDFTGQVSGSGRPADDLESPSSGSSVPEGVDWWNVTTSSDDLDVASLPLDVWDPLMQHDTGLSEIHITECLVDPWLIPSMASEFCTPPSTKEDDAKKGKWVRVERNLKLQVSMKSLNVYYRRTRRHDIPLVTEIRVLPEKETPSPFSQSWIKVAHPLNPFGEKRYLWYNAEKTWRDMTDAERKSDLITEIDVLFGSDQPWYGFERVQQATYDGGGPREPVWLTYRKGVKPPPRAPPLHFSRDGKFKIMQIADLHYSVSVGTCRDTILSPCTESDNLTTTLLSRVLDIEKPDFVVFTGDQLNGQMSSWDERSVLAKFAKAVVDRQIPWAAIFGNHDDEDGMSREAQLRYLQGLPYSLVERGPKDVHGVGNYVLKVKSADPSMTHLLTLYFLDSGAYSSGVQDWWGIFHASDYDYLRQDQIDWFLQESSSIDAIERPFTPDGAKDLGSVWKRQAADQVLPNSKRLAKPNAMMFFHIPMQESGAAADVDPVTGQPLDVGNVLEESGASKKSAGFFHKGLLQAFESDHRAGGRATEVKVVANGHQHNSDNCKRVKGVWLCFGGGGSYSGYGQIGFDRRFRIYDISDYGETIRTYKRTEHDDVLDDMILVGRGAPPPYEGVV
ncbi:Metallo-dependent phosphatase [Dichomitus squalens]|uniref:Metallo-dependent phosphatase n=1 Tax=Dichomitus squalens TaxID=114155 RepID=A0A4Q9MSP6_9APHY|nr:Metallo-dependent phosphatase [Dichomitus squalens]